MKIFKPNITRLRDLLQQGVLAYRACLQAIKNGDRKKAVKLQLIAVDSFNKFNDQLLEDLEHMRKPPQGTWAP